MQETFFKEDNDKFKWSHIVEFNVMPTAYDVPAGSLIDGLKDYLKKSGIINVPPFINYSKTGSQAERPPFDSDWYFYRAASILRKIYIYGPLSVKDLSKNYGGRKQRGFYLAHSQPAGMKHIRKILLDLEAAGLIKKTKAGRELTGKGISTVDKISSDIFDGIKAKVKAVEKLGIG